MDSNDRLSLYSRRDFGKIALASLPAAGLLANPVAALGLNAQARPNSVFGGVTIGIIGNLGVAPAGDLPAVIASLVAANISAVEIGSGGVETFAGAPAAPGGGGGRGRATAPAGGAVAPAAPARGAAGDAAAPAAARGGGGGGRAAQTPEQQAAAEAQAAVMKQWRMTAPMDKFREFRKLYNDAGIRIYAFRMTLTEDLSDAEYDYAFNAAKALGATSVSMELPTSAAVTKRIGDFAAKHQLMSGYHTHLQATPTIFDESIAQSRYNGIQLDIGHYVAATSQSPIPLIARHHARISSMHLKDRKVAGGPNMPWGQGDTPIKEVLQLMKKERYTWPAFIELEYPVPDGSTRAAEIGKCLQYCKDALA